MATPPPSNSRSWRQSLLQVLFAGYAVCYGLAVLFVAFLIVSGVPCMLTQAREDRARLDIKNISNALKLYRTRQGRYPTTGEGLRALVSIGALEEIPRDPWNDEYHYALRGGLPMAWSNGADGEPGGEGNDADVCNISRLPPWMMDDSHWLPIQAAPHYAESRRWERGS